MKELKTLQQNFQSYLLENDKEFIDDIAAPLHDDKAVRLEIYQHAYIARLIETLALDFVVLKAFIGDITFHTIAKAYIKAYPSHYFSLNPYGCHLASFLKNSQQFENNHFLSELADFEYALAMVFEAKQATLLTINDLQQIPIEDWPQLKFNLHPSIRLIKCEYNIGDLVDHYYKHQSMLKIKKLSETETWMIWCYDDNPYYQQLDNTQSLIINSILTGDHFAAICERICENLNENQASEFIIRQLIQWINQGIFCRSDFSPTKQI